MPGPPGLLDGLAATWKIGGPFGVATFAACAYIFYPRSTTDPDVCDEQLVGLAGGCYKTVLGPSYMAYDARTTEFLIELVTLGCALLVSLVVFAVVHVAYLLINKPSP